MRNDTYFGKSGKWFDKEIIELSSKAKVSKSKKNPELIAMDDSTSIKANIKLKENDLKKYVQKVKVNERTYQIVYTKNRLMIDDWHKLIPITKNKFYIEDLNYYIYFKNVNEEFIFDKVEKLSSTCDHKIAGIQWFEGVFFSHQLFSRWIQTRSENPTVSYRKPVSNHNKRETGKSYRVRS